MNSFNHYCSRCHGSKLGEKDFGIYLKTNEYYKTWNNCKEYEQQRRIIDKYKIAERDNISFIKTVENKDLSIPNNGLNKI